MSQPDPQLSRNWTVDPELPASYVEMLDKISGVMRQGAAEVTGTTPEKRDMAKAFAEMLLDLRYPVGKDGSVMNADFFAPLVAYHLVRCGWRPHTDKRIIKPRKVPGKGMVESAVEWVDASEPDDPLANLAHMSMAEVAALPEVWKHEAIRRLGGNVKSDLPEPKSGWKVDTRINITNTPRDPKDVFN